MKNVFFTLAFMLIGSFAFANNNVLKTSIAITENLSSESSLDADGRCTVIIRGYNADGECVGSAIHTLPANSAEECDKICSQILTLYQVGALKL